MIKKKAKTCKRGRQTGGFQGPFSSSKAVNTFTTCFPSPSLFIPAHKGAGMQSHRSCLRLTDIEQRCPKRKESASWSVHNRPWWERYRPRDSKEGWEQTSQEQALPAEITLKTFRQHGYWRHSTGIQRHRKMYTRTRSLALHSSNEEPKWLGQRMKFSKTAVALCT